MFKKVVVKTRLTCYNGSDRCCDAFDNARIAHCHGESGEAQKADEKKRLQRTRNRFKIRMSL